MNSEPTHYDVIVLGGGAAGLMCALTAGQRGRRVLLLERANRIGKKILMSGGGRCNFTNLNTTPANFISANPHFCKSALARYSPWEFLAMVDRHEIPWHEKGPGQLFCDQSSKEIVAMLASECNQARVEIRTKCEISSVDRGQTFALATSLGSFTADSLVVATGGLSIPRMGASDFGHRLARQFGLDVLPLRAGLVPFTLAPKALETWEQLSGVSLDVSASAPAMTFRENMLFTHRGLSGPAILQLSSYWLPGEAVSLNLMPENNPMDWLQEQRQTRPRQTLVNALAQSFSKRFADLFCEYCLAGKVSPEVTMAELTNEQMQTVVQNISAFTFYPNGTEGYRTAEVTLGGVNTDNISSKTMETKTVPGLYMIGEVLDVTGQLGGYNFQWACVSGWCAGQVV